MPGPVVVLAWATIASVVNLPADSERHPEQDGLLTLAEAADRLGVSIHTVRRQVKRGELKAEQVATRHGLA